MKCPLCGNDETKVVDSRATDQGAVRRRRECLHCKQRFTTYERLEEVPLAVIKKNGEREPFDRSKLLNGLVRATVKREIPLLDLENLVASIEADLRNQFKYEVSSKEIGEMVMKRLRKLDKVAYIRFASVYRQFQDLDEFTSELKRLQKQE
ncbi:MAG TPA: transcriptional regulator NrdR [Candidatus Subteraquimicrobiales bacterium]